VPYRRTENVERKLAARHDSILAAARELATEGGIAAVQIGPVAARAGIAAGTVYRYFPSKTELLTTFVNAQADRELAVIKRAADAAPGPLSALAAAITTFSARALADKRLAFALLAEPVDPEADMARIAYRKNLAGELERRIQAAIRGRHLPDQDPSASAAALVGALIEGLIGSLAPSADAATARAVVQALTLLGLRALGVVDARARGLVVQAQMPGAGQPG
jgi:AcrR family transcriptional regulator